MRCSNTFLPEMSGCFWLPVAHLMCLYSSCWLLTRLRTLCCTTLEFYIHGLFISAALKRKLIPSHPRGHWCFLGLFAFANVTMTSMLCSLKVADDKHTSKANARLSNWCNAIFIWWQPHNKSCNWPKTSLSSFTILYSYRVCVALWFDNMVQLIKGFGFLSSMFFKDIWWENLATAIKFLLLG